MFEKMEELSSEKYQIICVNLAKIFSQKITLNQKVCLKKLWLIKTK